MPVMCDVHTGEVEIDVDAMEKMMNVTTSRPRRIAMVAHDNKGVEHPCGDEHRGGRLPHFLAAVWLRLPAPAARPHAERPP